MKKKKLNYSIAFYIWDIFNKIITHNKETFYLEYLEEEGPEDELGGHGGEYEEESGYPSQMQEGEYNQQNSEEHMDQVSGEQMYEESKQTNQRSEHKDPEKHFSYDV